MKNLIEISKIVTKKKVKKIEIFDDHSLKHKNSKFNEFYEALMSNKFRNDRDAASFLYSCSPTDDKYRQLKSRFRKRLLNTLFFLDVNFCVLVLCCAQVYPFTRVQAWVRLI